MTSPNGRIPPGETPSPGSRYLGNGALWTDLYPNPIRPRPDDVRQDGAIEIKFGWWRGIAGRLRIEGRRLDAVASPLSAWIPGGYGRRGFQSTAITFPTAGCWQVTGSVGNASLTFVSLILEPTPPAAGGETSDLVARVPDELTRRRVVFTRANGTYVARADGSALRKLLDLEGVFEFQADVSPDGARLLLRVDDEGRKQGTWIVGLGGSRPTHVAGPGKPVAGGAADWAPDGRFVLAGKRAGERFLGLYVFAGKGSNPRRITPDEWEAQYPAWSPDGSRIAFTHVVPPNEFDIWVVNVDGSGLHQLTGEPGSDNYPAWSPDGRAIVYSSDDRSERNGLWIMGADGSEQRYLAAGGEPQWEPGEWIVFDCDLQDPERPGQVCVVRPDGSELARLPLGREAVFPNWAP